MVVIVGVGLIVIVYVASVPEQPLAEGVMVIIAVIGALVVLIAANAGTDDGPDPLSPRPIAVLLFVQVNVDPETGPVRAVTEAEDPLQYVWSAIVVTVGVGFTVIV